MQSVLFLFTVDYNANLFCKKNYYKDKYSISTVFKLTVSRDEYTELMELKQVIALRLQYHDPKGCDIVTIMRDEI